MKKPKPEGEPAKEPVPKSPIPWPSPDQIALIAATLARSKNDKPDALADAAIKLWKAAQRSIQTARNLEGWELISEPNKLPQPQSSMRTVDRDQFLRIMLPQYKNRPHDLARIARAYMRDTLREKNQREPSLDDVTHAYTNWKPAGLSKASIPVVQEEIVNTGTGWHVVENDSKITGNLPNYGKSAEDFRKWYRQYISKLRHAAGKKSAAKRQAVKKISKK